MAIIKTGAIYNNLVFGGINSADYGIYITGEAVFDAPKRAVNMVSVPGRNGAVAVDQGYWENITVTYPAGTFADSETNFASAVADFRNALASQVGYQRLTDSYHPSEYRMGMFIDGLDVEPVHYNEAGQFTLTFNCKPQRWLTSGESSTAITSGDTLTNPTLYNASPLLVASGHGTISFNGYDIELENVATVGKTLVVSGRTELITNGKTTNLSLNSSKYNSGDVITIGNFYFTSSIKTTDPVTSFTYAKSQNIGYGYRTPSAMGGNEYQILLQFYLHYVQSNSTNTYTNTLSGTIVHGAYTTTYTFTPAVTYQNNTLTYTATLTLGGDTDGITFDSGYFGTNDIAVEYDDVTVNSTLPISDAYIDCDLGETYGYNGTSVVDFNSYIDLGSDLPVLAPGSNTITYDNTITSLSITPRWWQL